MNHFKVPAVFAVLGAIACASTGPTPALVDARRAYEQASHSDAQRLAPDRVLAAKQALDAAERAHKDDAGSFEERSLAYVAERKSQLAQGYAALRRDEQQRQLAEKSYVDTQDRLRRQAEARADNAQNNLAQTRGALSEQEQRLNQERAARVEAEQSRDKAMESLRQIAQVKEESRGMVITLEGAVLFASAKSDLLPIAQKKLDQVATTLKDVDPTQKLVVEGYTDSRGADDANMRLSQQRAEAVRNYLVTRGIRPEMITAVGRGEASPVADNESAEGRATNRRVEIIVQPKQGPQTVQNNPSQGSSTPNPSSGSSTTR